MTISINLEYTAINPFKNKVAGHNFPNRYSTFYANAYADGNWTAEVKDYNRLIISHKVLPLTYEYAVCYNYAGMFIANAPSTIHHKIYEHMEKIAMLKLASVARTINNLHW